LIHKGQKFEGAFIAELMNGTTFSMYCLVPAIYMIVPMLLGTFTTMSFAGELENGQMRAILLRPVSRWKIFLCKFLAMVFYSFVLFVILFIISFLLGIAMFGANGDVIILGQVFSVGNSIFVLKESIATERMLMSYALGFFSSLYLIAMYMMFAALTRKIAYTLVISHGIYYISYVLLTIPFMKFIHPFLPTKYLAVWRFPAMEIIPWERLTYDIIIDSGYIFVFIVIGGLFFNSSDI
jgi:ABC-2 type transport system permease protein